MTATAFLLCSVGERRRLVRVAELREIVPIMKLESLEEGRGSFRGMLDLRGTTVPVFDLRGPDARLDPSRMILVTDASTEPVGLLVDEVHGVVTLEDASLARRPIGAGRSVTTARVDDVLVTVLDTRDFDRGDASDD